jgi:amino acid adenylation domain-containing protein
MPAKSKSVTALFHDQAARTPDSVAIADGALELTYRQLAEHACRLAHRLAALGCGRGDLVGLRGGLSADGVAAMLAILTAGAAYVPLEPSLPADRVRHMAADAGLRVVVVVPPLDWPPAECAEPGTAVLPYLIADQAGGGYPATRPAVAIGPDDLMYVPYTSGSTGQPKGVEVPHGAIPGFYEGEDYGEWGPGCRVLYHSAMSWDGHIFEIYPALLSGGTVVVHRGDPRDALEVTQEASRSGVAMLMLATQAFNTVAAERPAAFAGLRCVVVGGEAASLDHVARVMAAHPGLRIVNAYGPVECTCLATAQVITQADLGRPALPIGRPRGDRAVYLLDNELRLAAGSSPGEIYLGGPAVARGYLARPALTAERFVPDPFGEPGARLYRTGDLAWSDGEAFHFLGRTDDQVKLRGFRIEPGEIDVVLRGHPAVRDAATLVHAGPAGQRLVSYVVPGGEHVPQLRGYLRDRLPEAMVPAVIMGLEQFPVSHSGKLDRRALPVPPPPAASAAPEAARLAALAAGPVPGPAAEIILRLAAAWHDLLGLAPGPADDFFELGGDSLLATRLIARIRCLFGIAVSVRDIYDNPCLSELAEAISVRRLDPALVGAGALPS